MQGPSGFPSLTSHKSHDFKCTVVNFATFCSSLGWIGSIYMKTSMFIAVGALLFGGLEIPDWKRRDDSNPEGLSDWGAHQKVRQQQGGNRDCRFGKQRSAGGKIIRRTA